jgi:LAO/AO transport system kinase
VNVSSINNFKSLARNISIVENATQDFEKLLSALQPKNTPVIGFTGPPGAGKSTLLNAVIGKLLNEDKKIGLLLVDPSSPFNFGALLGDRLRMSAHFNNPNLFIRSLATRGSLGGLSDTIIEVLEVMKSYPFDFIFIETVGVGQSEVEIAGLADTTVVVLVPEAGDSIQAMKAGLMEIADVFAINKSDRSDADAIVSALQHQLHIAGREEIPVIKTIAVEAKGVNELIETFNKLLTDKNKVRRLFLLGEKVLRIIQKRRMSNFDVAAMRKKLSIEVENTNFNLYRFVSQLNS